MSTTRYRPGERGCVTIKTATTGASAFSDRTFDVRAGWRFRRCDVGQVCVTRVWRLDLALGICRRGLAGSPSSGTRRTGEPAATVAAHDSRPSPGNDGFGLRSPDQPIATEAGQSVVKAGVPRPASGLSL